MKKGFTLVEILAVLVILAVIGLIAIPIVSGIIANSKEKAAIQTAKNIARVAEEYYRKEQLMDRAVWSIDLTSNILKYDGEKPDKGLVVFDAGGKESLGMYYNGFCIKKDYNGDVIINKTTNSECVISTLVKQITPEECFEFNTEYEVGIILGYDKENPICPTDVTIPSTIGGVAVEYIAPLAFTVPKIMCEAYDNNGNYYIEEGSRIDFFASNNLRATARDIDFVERKYCDIDYFMDTRMITSVDFSNADNLLEIGEFAFFGIDMRNLGYNSNNDGSRNIQLMSTRTTLDHYSSYQLNAIKKVIFNSSLEYIGYGAFEENQIEIADFSKAVNLETIDSYAFVYNVITSLDLSKCANLNMIDYSSFANNRIGTLILPNRNVGIDCNAFDYNPLYSVINSSSLDNCISLR